MSVDVARIQAAMQGKNLDKENILKMYEMVRNASDPEEKKKVMKHSVFFAGQLPYDKNYVIDTDAVKKMLMAEVPYSQLDEVTDTLYRGLATQKLITSPSEGVYVINQKYENSVAKAGRIAKAYETIRKEEAREQSDSVRKMYQTGTRHYSAGDYEEAALCFERAASAGYRMASFSLGRMYHEGKGVQKSDEKALLYLCRALRAGAVMAEPLADEILSDLEGNKQ